MPYVYPTVPSVRTSQHGPRISLESEFAVEAELGPVQGGTWQSTANRDEDSDDDFTCSWIPRVSSHSRRDLPIPPARTVPPSANNWSDESVQPYRVPPPPLVPVPHTMQADSVGTQSPVPSYPSREANHYPVASTGRVYQPANEVRPSLFGWISSGDYLAGQQIGYLAPMLHPRDIQLPQSLIALGGTRQYPSGDVEPMRVSPIERPSNETIHNAFAYWYSDQVIRLLVTAGQFRPGVGGSSEKTWGLRGREEDLYRRIGRRAPEYKNPWGRLFMTETPPPVPKQVQQRRVFTETYDPFNVLVHDLETRSTTFVAFVLNMIHRMSIEPTGVVAAVWYLTGLSLHEGDGDSGCKLRHFLHDIPGVEHEAVEKRVATLGLMLAGKWLDDNSFLSKSWSKVTMIPLSDIERMERAALQDLHFSLWIPPSAWAEHVRKLFTGLSRKKAFDKVDSVVFPVLDELVTTAHTPEMCSPSDRGSPIRYEPTRAGQAIPATADEALNKDWGAYAREYAYNHEQYGRTNQLNNSQEITDCRDIEQDLLATATVNDLVDDDELALAERVVSALVDDDMDEEAFFEDDVANNWSALLSEPRPTEGHSTAEDSDPFQQPDRTHHAMLLDTEHYSRQRRSLGAPTPRGDSSDWGHLSNVVDAQQALVQAPTPTAPHGQPIYKCSQCGCEKHSQDTSRAYLPATAFAAPEDTSRFYLPTSAYPPPPAFDEETFLEPGISIIRGPTAPARSVRPT